MPDHRWSNLSWRWAWDQEPADHSLPMWRDRERRRGAGRLLRERRERAWWRRRHRSLQNHLAPTYPRMFSGNVRSLKIEVLNWQIERVRAARKHERRGPSWHRALAWEEHRGY